MLKGKMRGTLPICGDVCGELTAAASFLDDAACITSDLSKAIGCYRLSLQLILCITSVVPTPTCFNLRHIITFSRQLPPTFNPPFLPTAPSLTAHGYARS